MMEIREQKREVALISDGSANPSSPSAMESTFNGRQCIGRAAPVITHVDVNVPSLYSIPSFGIRGKIKGP